MANRLVGGSPNAPMENHRHFGICVGVLDCLPFPTPWHPWRFSDREMAAAALTSYWSITFYWLARLPFCRISLWPVELHAGHK
jgi:hypothetical protein